MGAERGVGGGQEGGHSVHLTQGAHQAYTDQPIDEVKSKRRKLLRCTMFAAVVLILTVITSCLVTAEFEDYNTLEIHSLFDPAKQANPPSGLSNRSALFSYYNESELVETPGDHEMLPTPLPELGPEPRNYVAYIPVPINDDEESEDEEDEEEEIDEDEDEEYYEEEEEKPVKQKVKKGSSKKIKRKTKRKNVQKEEKDKERVPFLVPLMMVPENQVGVRKEFSFSQDKKPTMTDELFSNVINNNIPNRRVHNNFRNVAYRDGRPVHNLPGPPYRGAPPRNPNLPLDDTIIHPSIHRPVYQRPPRRFGNNRFYDPSRFANERLDARPTVTLPTTTTTTTTTTTSTTEATTEKSTQRSSIIVVQQPSLGSPYGYMNPYGFNQQPYFNYQPPQSYPPQYYNNYSPPETTTAATTTTTTSTTTTTTETTKKPRKKKKKTKNVDPMLSEGSLTIVNNKLVPIKSRETFQRKTGPQSIDVSSRRISAVWGNNRDNRKYPVRRYRPNMYRPNGGNRRFDTIPNIFTQSGFDFEDEDEKPIIKRPPPKHPGVRLPGIKVPPNAGNIQDILSDSNPNDIRRYTTQNGKYTIINDYRPPIGEKGQQYKPAGSYIPNNKYPPSQSINYHPSDEYDEDIDDHSFPIEFDAAPPKFHGDIQEVYQTYPSSPNKYQPNTATYENEGNKYQTAQNQYINQQDVSSNYPSTPSQYQPSPTQYQSSPNQYQSSPNQYQSSPNQHQSSPNQYQSQNQYQAPNNQHQIPQNQYTNQYQPSPSQQLNPSNQYQSPPPQNQYQPSTTYYQPTSPPYVPTLSPYQPNLYNQQAPTSPNYIPNPPAYSPSIRPYSPPTQPPFSPSIPPYSPPTQPPYPPTQSSYIIPQSIAKPAENIVPPAYNPQYFTPDSISHFPGPEIFDNGSVQGPNPEISSDKLDTFSSPDDYDFGNKYTTNQNNYKKRVPTSKRPNGPDYSSATVLQTSDLKGSVPFRVGLDLYPMSGYDQFGKQGLQSLATNFNGDDNKHEVLVHLNLFSKKPSELGGRVEDVDVSQSFGPFSLGRNEELAIQEAKNLPKNLLFGSLNPIDILNHLMNKGRARSIAKEEKIEKNLGREPIIDRDEDALVQGVKSSSKQADQPVESADQSKFKHYYNPRLLTNPVHSVDSDVIEKLSYQTNHVKETTEYEYDYGEYSDDSENIKNDNIDDLNDESVEVKEDFETLDKKDPEYYYYYYYDYQDSGIDISHEIEPLPKPMWQVSEISQEEVKEVSEISQEEVSEISQEEVKENISSNDLEKAHL